MLYFCFCFSEHREIRLWGEILGCEVLTQCVLESGHIPLKLILLKFLYQIHFLRYSRC